MKSGVRALGIAESYRRQSSTLCGAVVTGEGIVDGIGFRSIDVGGTDATDSVVALWDEVGRPDVRVLLLSGVALAWYNIVDHNRLSDAIPIPVLSLTYEASDGLQSAIEREFDGEAARVRLERYDALPARRECDLGDESVFVRAINADDINIEETLQSLTRAGGRPEPVRVARIAARAADEYRHRWLGNEGN